MKLEVGKTYVDRKGNAVTILYNDNISKYPYLGSNHETYREDGSTVRDVMMAADLVAEAKLELSEEARKYKKVPVMFNGELMPNELKDGHADKPLGGAKHDALKPPLSLVPLELLEATSQALQHGVKKYGKNNYKQGFDYSRLIDAALRHLNQFASGEDNDSESGVSHLGHAAASIGMLLYIIKNSKGRDDR